ncbi:MAG TPA: TolC family protein [Puia sp.]|nr:TolC family protein [Puia sp.]
MNTRNKHADRHRDTGRDTYPDSDPQGHPYMHMNNFHDMNIVRPFIYTIIIFLALCLASYVAGAQTLVPTQALQENQGAQQDGDAQASPSQKALSLKEALSQAREHNRDIKIARLDIARSGQEKIVAKSLSLPSAGIGAQASHYFLLPPFFGFGNGGSNGLGNKVPYARYGGKDQLSATLWVSQSLYNPASRPALRRSEQQEQQSSLLLRDKETETEARVRQTYLQILVLGERIRLQKESLHRNQKALDDARSLLAQGRALRVDTLRAFTSVKNLEPDLLKLSYAIEVGKLQLKTLIGSDSAQQIELSDSLVLPTPESIPAEAEVYAEAEKNRPDLRALVLQPGIDDQQILIAAAARKPTVALVGQYQVQTQTGKFDYFNSAYPSTPFVGAQVSVPLFSGYGNKAKVSEAKIVRQQSVIQVDNAREQLRSVVRQAVANALEAASRIQTRITVKEAAALSYDITQYRYANGVASRLELTDAELALTTAQSNYLEAVYDYISARIELDRTRGR